MWVYQPWIILNRLAHSIEFTLTDLFASNCLKCKQVLTNIVFSWYKTQFPSFRLKPVRSYSVRSIYLWNPLIILSQKYSFFDFNTNFFLLTFRDLKPCTAVSRTAKSIKLKQRYCVFPWGLCIVLIFLPHLALIGLQQHTNSIENVLEKSASWYYRKFG